MKKQDLYRQTIQRWGREAQIDMFHEEVGEFLSALNKFKRGSDTDFPDWTPITCAIQRDIFARMVTDKTPISQRSYDICQKDDCPFRQETRPRKKYEKNKHEPKLFEI